MTHLRYTAPAISCDHCKHAIETAVRGLPGVTRVTVDVEHKTVEVDGSAAEPAVRAAIAEAGYDATMVSPT